MSKIINVAGLLFLAVLFTGGCTSRRQILDDRLIESTGSPAMKSAPGEGSFIGVSRPFSDEQSAREDAALHARRQIIEALEIGIELESVERVMLAERTGESFSENVLVDTKIKTIAKNILHVTPDGYYVEKRELPTSGGGEAYYKAWCRVRYSQADHHHLLANIVLSILSRAEPEIQLAKEARAQGRVRESVLRLNHVLRSSMELSGYHGVPPELEKEIDDLQTRCEIALRDIRILVVVDETIHGEHPAMRLFEPRLIEGLTGMNSIAVASMPRRDEWDPALYMQGGDAAVKLCYEFASDLLLLGRAAVNSVEKKYEGLFAARAEIQLQLIEPSTGVVIWEDVLPGKTVKDTRGFAGTAGKAAQRALSLAELRSRGEDPFAAIANSLSAALHPTNSIEDMSKREQP